jgi:hypothetical protein
MTIVKPPYHVGIVVADVERAMTELTAILGVSWGRVQRRENRVEAADGTVTAVDVCFAYTLDGPPYLEVIEQRSGSVFETLGLHHIGVWANDPHAESGRLEELGWPRESVSLTPDGAWGGGLYHHGLDCVRVEIVDIARSGPRLVNYLGGGDYASPE